MVRPVPDDERPRRRLGDETKERIADLASGWSLDGKDDQDHLVAFGPPDLRERYRLS